MTQMSYSEAYRILTRELTNMHYSERDVLDRSPYYLPTLNAVMDGKKGLAISLAYNHLRTEKGDDWRTRKMLPFTANAE